MPSAGNLINYIKTHGENLLGAELGVWRAENLCYILNECSNIKKIYAIDPYLPYMDGTRWVSEEEQSAVKNTADSEINKYNLKDRIISLQFQSDEASSHIENNSLDFVYVDGDHSFEWAYKDFVNYYPKVKIGGIFAGHDYSCEGVLEAIIKFSSENGIDYKKELIECTNDSWFWYKK
jgi:hypothetical protein